ncbi:MAG: hypothetical protein ACR2MN_04150 [Acidimicrobiales bacterium]
MPPKPIAPAPTAVVSRASVPVKASPLDWEVGVAGTAFWGGTVFSA